MMLHIKYLFILESKHLLQAAQIINVLEKLLNVKLEKFWFLMLEGLKQQMYKSKCSFYSFPVL